MENRQCHVCADISSRHSWKIFYLEDVQSSTERRIGMGCPGGASEAGRQQPGRQWEGKQKTETKQMNKNKKTSKKSDPEISEILKKKAAMSLEEGMGEWCTEGRAGASRRMWNRNNWVSWIFLLLQLEKSISEQKWYFFQKVVMYREIWCSIMETYGEECEKVKYDIEILEFGTESSNYFWQSGWERKMSSSLFARFIRRRNFKV